jgi:hypothetical protein
MNAIFDFLNQPIVIALVTLTVGSYLLNLVADRRARNNKLRDKAIDFISEAGNIINGFCPHVYRQLRMGNIVVDQSIEDGLKELFSKRMSIQVGSQAYLKSEVFYKQYHELIDELADVVASMRELEHGASLQAGIERIREHKERLRESWPSAEDFSIPYSESPIEELISWMDMIMYFTTNLLATNLESVLG